MEIQERFDSPKLEPLPIGVADFADAAKLRFVIRFYSDDQDLILVVEDARGKQRLPFWHNEGSPAEVLVEVFFREFMGSSLSELKVGDYEEENGASWQHLSVEGETPPVIKPSRFFKPVWVPNTGQFSE